MQHSDMFLFWEKRAQIMNGTNYDVKQRLKDARER